MRSIRLPLSHCTLYAQLGGVRGELCPECSIPSALPPRHMALLFTLAAGTSVTWINTLISSLQPSPALLHYPPPLLAQWVRLHLLSFLSYLPHQNQLQKDRDLSGSSTQAILDTQLVFNKY